jgi:hypothetical protein
VIEFCANFVLGNSIKIKKSIFEGNWIHTKHILYHLGSFDTNYIICENVEYFNKQFHFVEEQKFYSENKESFKIYKILYFENEIFKIDQLIIWHSSVETTTYHGTLKRNCLYKMCTLTAHATLVRNNNVASQHSDDLDPLLGTY